jgi:hypothetical protein
MIAAAKIDFIAISVRFPVLSQQRLTPQARLRAVHDKIKLLVPAF